MVRQRRSKESTTNPQSPTTTSNKMPSDPSSSSPYSHWIFYAIASGACAAFNGVFAKLTTTTLTSSMSTAIANVLGLSSFERAVEVFVRASFFILNLTFNGVMWTLFTQALAKGTSTVQVSIMNTSTNFMLTALLGLFVFSESLPPMWWAGASLLVAGNVIIGSKKEEGKGAEQEEHANVNYTSVALSESVETRDA